MTGWKPEYPGQEREPVWVWWDRDEPEDGLLGFHTSEDCRRFSNSQPGPYRRRVAEDGRTIPQVGGWSEMISRFGADPWDEKE
jgi:hypothetical protein